jgi:glycosyltransferase involved in cell wall biosynthesis
MAVGPARVLLLTVGDRDSPGTRLRAFAYVPFLESRGHRVELRVPLGSQPNRLRRRRLLRAVELIRDLGAASRSDLVIVYRKTFPDPTARWLRRVARRVVYDFDDAVYLPSPAEPQDPTAVARYRRNFDATVQAADLVVAGNRELAAAVESRPSAILPTGVDLSVFTPISRSRRGSGCVLGWIGTTGNLPQWQRLEAAFRRVVAAEPEVRFKVISDRRPPELDLPVDYERFTIDREAACLEDVDVGLMPLEDTPWNRGKCSYKALQCMALGLPVVVSPVGMNREAVEPGVSGAFAVTEDEWVDELLRLVRDPERRERMGRAARAVVERSYSLQRVGVGMADLVDQLLSRPARR